MSEKKDLTLSKCSLFELEEILQRQNALIKNRNLLKHLRDQGASIMKTREKVLEEIEQRKTMKHLESALSNVNITTPYTSENIQKHVEYVCSKDKLLEGNKFKPYSSRAHLQKIVRSPSNTNTSNSSVVQHNVDISAASEPKLLHQPAVIIPLSQSLNIQKQQMQRVIEKQTGNLLEQLFIEEDDSSAEDQNCVGSQTIEMDD